MKPVQELKQTATSVSSQCWLPAVTFAAKLGLVTLCIAGWLYTAPSASARHRHKIREANGKIFSCVYRLQDVDVPWSTFLLYPSPIRLDLQSLLHESSQSDWERELQQSILKDCSDDRSIKLDDILNLSQIYEQQDRREALFHCTDLLLNVLHGTDNTISDLNLNTLRQSAESITQGVAEQQLDQSEVYVSKKSYGDAVVLLDSLVHLKDTKSAAVEHLDWKEVVAKMKSIRPFVPELQQGLLDWDMFKATYDPNKVLPSRLRYERSSLRMWLSRTQTSLPNRCKSDDRFFEIRSHGSVSTNHADSNQELI